jgi:hypothetical protein
LAGELVEQADVAAVVEQDEEALAAVAEHLVATEFREIHPDALACPAIEEADAVGLGSFSSKILHR